ncbi:hypothetical protein RsS62_03930 [Rhizobium dioscoreae]|nr:hypothetical protein RsS62_03930 [Rhizobium dioscoreae]
MVLRDHSGAVSRSLIDASDYSDPGLHPITNGDRDTTLYRPSGSPIDYCFSPLKLTGTMEKRPA